MHNHEFFQLITLPNGKTKIISIVGPTGSGKTSLGESLSLWTGWPHINETPLTDNPVHNEFYQALKREDKPNDYALASQLFFFFDAFLNQTPEVKKKLEKEHVIWGGHPIHHLMYAYLLYKNGSLSKKDYTRYRKVFIQCLPLIPVPDLVVNTCRKRGEDTCEAIKKRAKETPPGPEKKRRMEEIGVSAKNWKEQIEYWIARIMNEELLPHNVSKKLETSLPKVLTVKLDPDEINWLTKDAYGNKIDNPEGEKAVLDKFAAAIKGVQAQASSG